MGKQPVNQGGGELQPLGVHPENWALCEWIVDWGEGAIEIQCGSPCPPVEMGQWECADPAHT